MKDLYRRNRLRPRESNRLRIHNADGNDEDREAAFTVLLNERKKREYDRVHATLSKVGYIRRHLGLGGRSSWRRHYEDFLQPLEEETRVRPRRKRSLVRIARRLFAISGWALPLLILTLSPLILSRCSP